MIAMSLTRDRIPAWPRPERVSSPQSIPGAWEGVDRRQMCSLYWLD